MPTQWRLYRRLKFFAVPASLTSFGRRFHSTITLVLKKLLMKAPFFSKLPVPAVALVSLLMSALTKIAALTVQQFIGLYHVHLAAPLRFGSLSSTKHSSYVLLFIPVTAFIAHFCFHVFLGPGCPCCHQEPEMWPDILLIKIQEHFSVSLVECSRDFT